MPNKDYYSILGVNKGATEKELRQAYRRLARKHHPDVNPGDKAADAKFKEINEAYEVLSDADKRKKYDRYGDKWQYADQFEAQRQGSARFDFGGNNFDLSDLVGNIFRSGSSRQPGYARRPRPREYAAEVSLEEAFRGTTRLIDVGRAEICDTCNGDGRIAGAVCHVCGGDGLVERAQRLEVKIPAGVRDGSRIRVASSGGEVYLRASVQPHGRFERKGDDLYTDVSVPMTDAILGGEVGVPTLAGKQVMLKVAPLTQNGRLIRLTGLGMPHMEGSGKGHLYARVKIVLPETLSDRERELFEELRSLQQEKVGT